MTVAPSITLNGTANIGGATLFSSLDLTLPAGKWTCLLGGSGVGKSTILRLIAGLYTGAEFKGKITSNEISNIPQNIAYMAQDDLLLPWATVTENIALGAKLRGEHIDRARIADLLDRVKLSAHADKKPKALSGGQRQRVALARLLMEDRPITLLDEPFSALDAQTRAQMQSLAVKLLNGRTVLMVTHDPAEAARLGLKIAILTPNGLSDFKAPQSKIPREVDAKSTLDCQAALLRALMETGS